MAFGVLVMKYYLNDESMVRRGYVSRSNLRGEKWKIIMLLQIIV